MSLLIFVNTLDPDLGPVIEHSWDVYPEDHSKAMRAMMDFIEEEWNVVEKTGWHWQNLVLMNDLGQQVGYILSTADDPVFVGFDENGDYFFEEDDAQEFEPPKAVWPFIAGGMFLVLLILTAHLWWPPVHGFLRGLLFN